MTLEDLKEFCRDGFEKIEKVLSEHSKQYAKLNEDSIRHDEKLKNQIEKFNEFKEEQKAYGVMQDASLATLRDDFDKYVKEDTADANKMKLDIAGKGGTTVTGWAKFWVWMKTYGPWIFGALGIGGGAAF